MLDPIYKISYFFFLPEFVGYIITCSTVELCSFIALWWPEHKWWNGSLLWQCDCSAYLFRTLDLGCGIFLSGTTTTPCTPCICAHICPCLLIS